MNNNQSRPDLNWVNGHPMHAMQYGIESIVPDLWNGTKPELVINGPNKGNVIWPWLQRIPNAITAAYASALPWLPDECVTTPRSRCCAVSLATTFDPTARTQKVSGTFCGRAVDVTTTLPEPGRRGHGGGGRR